MTPTLVAARSSLPPEGALAPWGGPAPLDVTPTLVAARTSLSPKGALAPWGGPAPLDVTPTLVAARSLRPSPHRQRGFTLLELLVVVAIIAVATAGVGLALRDSGQTQLERDGERLVALLESARAQSRATGVVVRWRPNERGFAFEGLAPGTLPTQWLAAGVAPADNTPLVLGPEPIIGAQSVLLMATGTPARQLRIGTDGLRPFAIQASP